MKYDGSLKTLGNVGIFYMAAPVEMLANQIVEPTNEVYGHSKRNLRVMGQLALQNLVATPEYSGAYNEAFTDFIRAVAENLTTDKEFGESLGFDPIESFEIRDGEILDKDGKPFEELVKEGLKKSREAAEFNPEMHVQAERDEGDEIIIGIVQNLREGEIYVLNSREPAEELERNPEFWRDELNYTKGLSVLQIYYRKSKTELLAGYYSLKNTNPRVLREIFAEQGTFIPEHESPNRWSRYGIRKQVSELEARALGRNLVARHRRDTGQIHPMYSATELVNRELCTARQYFDTYIVPLTQALKNKKNNLTMSSFAVSLLNHVTVLEPEEVHRLMHVANSSEFNEDDANFMEEKVRYALIEELRKHIPNMITGVKQLDPKNDQTMYRPSLIRETANPLQLQILNEQAARNVASGIAAGRTYSGFGCTGAGNNRKQNQLAVGSGTQNVFGGNAEGTPDDESSDSGECKYSGSYCYCCPYDVDGKTLSKPIETLIVRDKSEVAHCQRFGCGATLDKYGKGDRGMIYKKAMDLKRWRYKTVGRVAA